jgi:NAD(P)H-hydrate epimerase
MQDTNMAVLTRQQIREVDRRAIQEYGMSGLVLMENAGRNAANLLFRLMSADFHSATKQFQSGPVTIICGKGNNGGDGFVIARHLDLFGLEVRLLLLCSPDELTGDAAANFSIIRKVGLSIEVYAAPLDIARFDAAIVGSAWLIDAILGTGASGEPKSPYAEAIDRMNASGLPIFAVDLPSGLDCDSGAPAEHTIRASHTCTFVASKPGFSAESAKPYTGRLHVVDIGAPRRLLEEVKRTALGRDR